MKDQNSFVIAITMTLSRERLKGATKQSRKYLNMTYHYIQSVGKSLPFALPRK